ncbi:MAG: DbpA RNA binding domain-containing protein, partial [Myxococcales bacterium]|nr:DbpA RNA binding domain-containing protein [Myxococcales bacterium]
LPQNDRERIMSATKEGRLRFLVATDVAARGIDISHLTHVINYDFPETAEQYVHRTGRTGRAGRTGTAIALVGPKDIGNVYLLRLTYKIRPIEKQLPSAGERRTRAELDLVQIFVDAFASRQVHPDDLALARRLLTHDDAERIVAGLLRDHLGAREAAAGAAVSDAAEARRARNPRPRPEPPAPSPEMPAVSASRAPASPPLAAPAMAAPAMATPAAATPAAAGASPAAPGVPSRAARPVTAPGRSVRSRGRAESRANAEWSPPAEEDDERPILSEPLRRGPPVPDPESRLPGITISDAVPPPRPGRAPAPADPGGRGPASSDASDPRGRDAAEPIDPDFVDLFVNIGRREGVGPGDLQRLLLERGLSADDTGKIRVRDRMSYVRVRKDVFERAVEALAGQVIGGRTVIAELARR